MTSAVNAANAAATPGSTSATAPAASAIICTKFATEMGMDGEFRSVVEAEDSAGLKKKRLETFPSSKSSTMLGVTLLGRHSLI